MEALMELFPCLKFSMILPDMLIKEEEKEKDLSPSILSPGMLTFLISLISERIQEKNKIGQEICSMDYGFPISS